MSWMDMIPGVSYAKILGGIAVIGAMLIAYNLIIDHLDHVDALEKQALADAVVIASQVGQLKNADTEKRMSNQQFEFQEERDRDKQERIIVLQGELDSQDRQTRLANLKSSRRATLVLRIINRSAACEWKNFDNFNDGECRGGAWRDE